MSKKYYLYDELVEKINQDKQIIEDLTNRVKELENQLNICKQLQIVKKLDIAMLENFILEEDLTKEQQRKLMKIMKVSE